MTKSEQEKKEWYTPQEVATMFRVDPKTVIRWEDSGKLEKFNIRVSRTIGNHRRYNKEDTDRAFLELNPQLKPKEPETEDD